MNRALCSSYCNAWGAAEAAPKRYAMHQTDENAAKRIRKGFVKDLPEEELV